MYSYLEIIPASFTDEQVREYYALRKSMDVVYGDPVNDDFALFREGLFHHIEKGGFHIYILQHDGKMIGYVRYLVTNAGHPAQMNSVFGLLPPEHLVPEMKKMLAEWLLMKMEKEGHTQCMWRSFQPELIQFIRSLGARQSNTGHWFRLDPRQVNASLIREWAQAVDPEQMYLTLKCVDLVPEELMEETARASNEMINDMVREDSRPLHMSAEALRAAQQNFRRNKSIPVHLLLSDKEQRIIGMSLLVMSEGAKGVADQRVTGISREWRRKGLAKWLKAKMIEKVQSEFPLIEEIRTECFSVNLPMININKALGYQLYRIDQDQLLTPENLESFLNTP